jgi:integrase
MRRAPTVRRVGDGWGFVADATPPGAPRRQIRRQGFATKAAATAALTAIMAAQSEGGEYREPSKVTLGDYASTSWLPAVERSQLKPTTKRFYADMYTLHVAPALGDHQLRAITSEEIHKLLDALQADPTKGRGGSGLSASSAARVRVTIGKLLGAAVKDGLLVRNPVEEVETPRGRTVERTAWAVDQVGTFLDAIGNDHLAPLFHAALRWGLRRGELVGLRWRDVDLDAASLRIVNTRTLVGYAVVEGPPKSERSNRTIYVDPQTVEVLRDHLARQREARRDAGLDGDALYVFTAEDADSPLVPDVPSLRFGRLQRQLAKSGVELPRLSFHEARHSALTNMIVAAGLDLLTVSRLAGHSSIDITVNTYGHLSDDAAKLAAARVGAAFDGEVKLTAVA